MIFSIPLRSKQSTKDWDNVSHRLKVTIDSIFAQTKQDFLIVIAGHEKPDFLNQDYYKDIVFLTVPFPTPTEQSQFMADKLGKKRYTGSYINRLLKEDEFRIVMQMDADDIIHPEFIENISNIFHHDPSIDDVALMSGYAFDFKRQKLAFLNGVDKLFYRNCGSSFISKVFKRDLSENINEKSYFNSLVNHVSFPNIARENGRKVFESNYSGVMYLVNHGSNDVSERIDGNKRIKSFIDSFAVDSCLHPVAFPMIKSALS